MAVSKIISSDEAIPIDEPFKVFAGPGAGKTYWLTMHIGNVLSKSKMLGAIRKIACISYTNVGADTIRERLPLAASCVEITTIHSFLYTHVVKPFLHLDADKYDIDVTNLKVVPTESYNMSGYVNENKHVLGYSWIPTEHIVKGLQKAYWHYDKGEFVMFAPKFPVQFYADNGKKYTVSKQVYEAFHSLLWKNGYISYDDVLYFAIKLIHHHPEILNSVVARFPYFFVDEFQDSIPPIVDFIKEIGRRGAVIGVIGDKAQTIYDFIGASVEQFDNFALPGMKEYEIRGNRRSSPQIVSLLNVARPDFVQACIGTMEDILPVLIVGDKLDAYQYAMELSKSEDIHTLAYQNIVANSMKYKSTEKIVEENLIDSDFDSNYKRAMLVRNLIKATEYAYVNDLSEAWRQLSVLCNDRGNAIKVLRLLLNNRSKLLNSSLIKFLRFVKEQMMSNLPISKMKSAARNFYDNHKYIELALSMKVSDCSSIHKTIHKAKGEEYENVLVVLESEDDLSLFVSPDLVHSSTQRVYYVAMSRAIKKLFINVDSISDITERAFVNLPIEIVKL